MYRRVNSEARVDMFRLADELKTDAESLITLSHVNVVKLHAMIFEYQHYGVVLEFAAFGPLDAFIHKYQVHSSVLLSVLSKRLFTNTRYTRVSFFRSSWSFYSQIPCTPEGPSFVLLEAFIHKYHVHPSVLLSFFLKLLFTNTRYTRGSFFRSSWSVYSQIPGTPECPSFGPLEALFTNTRYTRGSFFRSSWSVYSHIPGTPECPSFGLLEAFIHTYQVQSDSVRTSAARLLCCAFLYFHCNAVMNA